LSPSRPDASGTCSSRFPSRRIDSRGRWRRASRLAFLVSFARWRRGTARGSRSPAPQASAPAAIGERRDGRGEVPEEDQVHPPRAAPGSRNLPWDGYRIPTKLANLQASAGLRSGGWDGGLAFARGVVGGIVPGSGTSGTAKTPSAGDSCVVGRRRGDNAPGGQRPRGVTNTRRLNASGGGEVPVRTSPRWTAIRRRRSRLGPARGHAANPLFRA